MREIRRYNREMQGYSTGSTSNNGGGPTTKIDMDQDTEAAGCCSSCVVM